MRVLHFVKTVDGAKWAVDQVAELVLHGIDVHVVLPNLEGRLIEDWRKSGACIHQLTIDISPLKPWHFNAILNDIRNLISEISPEIIHSHFFITTLALRYALGKNHPTPRVFQVPGPLHLEHAFFRNWELSCAGVNDFWIASSKYTYDLYIKAGVKEHPLFLSYYGNRHHTLPIGSAGLREKYKINKNQFVVGNVNYMYPPKWYLGQTKGIKRHEDVIDALDKIAQKRKNIVGLIIGKQWGAGNRYEKKLKARINIAVRDHIVMTGQLSTSEAKSAWVDFDVAVHVPVSENCGGVIEPLMAGVPVIAARTGGLPEVILDGITGVLVEPCNPTELARAIDNVLADLPRYKLMAERGKKLVNHMFNVKRTAIEILSIYKYILNRKLPKPEPFNSRTFVNEL